MHDRVKNFHPNLDINITSTTVPTGISKAKNVNLQEMLFTWSPFFILMKIYPRKLTSQLLKTKGASKVLSLSYNQSNNISGYFTFQGICLKNEEFVSTLLTGTMKLHKTKNHT